jgi:hypothetical protein
MVAKVERLRFCSSFLLKRWPPTRLTNFIAHLPVAEDCARRAFSSDLIEIYAWEDNIVGYFDHQHIYTGPHTNNTLHTELQYCAPGGITELKVSAISFQVCEHHMH